MNQSRVCPGKTEQTKGGGRWFSGKMASEQILYSLTPVKSDRKGKRKDTRRRGEGVELLCNNNMVLKSKYQALATSAEIQRKGGGGAERRGYKK